MIWSAEQHNTGANTDFPWQNVDLALMSAKQTRPLPLIHVSLNLSWTWSTAAVRGYPTPFTVLIWKTNVSPLEIMADLSFALIIRSRSSYAIEQNTRSWVVFFVLFFPQDLWQAGFLWNEMGSCLLVVHEIIRDTGDDQGRHADLVSASHTSH